MSQHEWSLRVDGAEMVIKHGDEEIALSVLVDGGETDAEVWADQMDGFQWFGISGEEFEIQIEPVVQDA